MNNIHVNSTPANVRANVRANAPVTGTSTGWRPTRRLRTAVGKFLEKVRERCRSRRSLFLTLMEINNAGAMRETHGLLPTTEGTRLTWSDGTISTTDGPFTETKEVVGGYSITETKDKAEAVEWVRRFLEIHPENWTVSAEVRQIEED